VNLTAKQKRILTWVGYGAFYLFALVLFAYLTFPYDRLRDRIQNEFNARQTGPNPMTLRLGHMSSYWLGGVEADSVDLITPPSTDPPSGEASDEPPKAPKAKVMHIDSVHARVSLLRLLFGTVHVNFGADAFGGKISGFTSDADGGRKLAVDIDDLSLADAPMIGDLIGLPVLGKLAGSLEFLLPEGKLAKAEGKVDLKFSDLAVGDGKAKILNTIALPKLTVGELGLQATATAGNLKLDNFAATGKDLEFQADGSVRLRDPLDGSLLSLNARFKFSDRFTNKDDMTRGLFGAPGSTIPGLFDLDPKTKRAKRPDGFYAWHVNGTMSRPTFLPADSGGGAGGMGAAGRGIRSP